jgi:LmbE family N-acetylglucosaminyl deacetylase
MPRADTAGVVPAVASVLVVCAHPDDESFGLGAVLHRFVANGSTVSVLCFTRGEASTLGPSLRVLTEVRSAELADAAAALGIGEVALLGHPDGSLAGQSLDVLATEVQEMAAKVGAQLLLVFDEGGVTGHPDHCRATEAALTADTNLPVLAWTLPCRVANALNAEFDTCFVGRDDEDIDLALRVDRTNQREAISRHSSQSGENPVLWRRLELLGQQESLRWLRPPPGPPIRPTS